MIGKEVGVKACERRKGREEVGVIREEWGRGIEKEGRGVKDSCEQMNEVVGGVGEVSERSEEVWEGG
uniref:hypothetical protein n=1 Tax=Paenibacillus xylanexedens TaxID=528191 RepID=UPI0011A972F6